MAHTPGPWTASHRHVYGSNTDDEMGGLGWDVDGPPEPMLRGQFAKAADAHLIAAAPELLAAGEAIAEWARETGYADDEGGLFDTLDAAIAKARGTGNAEQGTPS